MMFVMALSYNVQLLKQQRLNRKKKKIMASYVTNLLSFTI